MFGEKDRDSNFDSFRETTGILEKKEMLKSNVSKYSYSNVDVVNSYLYKNLLINYQARIK
jgi:hypothetical protein